LYCVQNADDGRQKTAAKRRKSEAPSKKVGYVQPKLDVTI